MLYHGDQPISVSFIDPAVHVYRAASQCHLLFRALPTSTMTRSFKSHGSAKQSHRASAAKSHGSAKSHHIQAECRAAMLGGTYDIRLDRPKPRRATSATASSSPRQDPNLHTTEVIVADAQPRWLGPFIGKKGHNVQAFRSHLRCRFIHAKFESGSIHVTMGSTNATALGPARRSVEAFFEGQREPTDLRSSRCDDGVL